MVLLFGFSACSDSSKRAEDEKYSGIERDFMQSIAAMEDALQQENASEEMIHKKIEQNVAGFYLLSSISVSKIKQCERIPGDVELEKSLDDAMKSNSELGREPGAQMYAMSVAKVSRDFCGDPLALKTWYQKRILSQIKEKYGIEIDLDAKLPMLDR